ncbi:MAG: PD40 domain-containing protein, partial [Armatimonadetes bacterium]|nr:PD40 domain-containing protein [Armatimonadota bacterium]
MRRRSAAWLILAAGTCLAAPAPDLDGAAWIWTSDSAGLNAERGTRYLRTVFDVPAGGEGATAALTATADNLLTVYLNGTVVLSRTADPDAWNRPLVAQVGGLLVPGRNCLAAVVTNTAPGAAGLVAKLTVPGRPPVTVVTDGGWRGSVREAPGWMRPEFDDSGWPAARVHGDFGMPPWGTMGLTVTPAVPLDFEGASWIWTPEPKGLGAVSAGTACFRAWLELPADTRGMRAEAILTCDNAFTLYVNGRRVGRGTEWTQTRRFDLTAALQPGRNLLAVQGLNTLSGPAGLLAKFAVTRPGADPVVRVTDGSWRCSLRETAGWRDGAFDDSGWPTAQVWGAHPTPPWAVDLRVPPAAQERAGRPIPRLADWSAAVHRYPVVFVQGLVQVSARGENFVQYINDTRAYTEFDTPSPGAVGKRLCALSPFRPGGRCTVLCDARGGVLGSPSVSFDGRTVWFALAPEGDAFFHLYAVGLDGTGLRQLTSGPFHDFDPVELPDGRLAFSSTRCGTAEEYHGVPAFSLFTCRADGAGIERLTSHIVGDREPRVAADGSLVFVRCDNFLERAKVETHIHRVRADGTGGTILLGPDRPSIGLDRRTGAEVSQAWLRSFGAGVPAPLPDGRVAAVTEQGLMVPAGQRGTRLADWLPYDQAPLPDGRLLCTDRDNWRLCVLDPATGGVREALDLEALGLPPLDNAGESGLIADAIHSAVSAAPQTRPPLRPAALRPTAQTGFLYCQNALLTRHAAADMARVKGIRILEGRPFTLSPTKSIYMHIGTEARELGTLPLAADGSFYAEVPADRPLALQAVDGEGRAVISELSWIYVRPGERRACVGCHARSADTPPTATVRAVSAPALRLTGEGVPHRFRANNAANGGVLNLQFDRFREAAAINLHAQGAAASRDPLPPGRAAEVAALTAELAAREPAQRA